MDASKHVTRGMGAVLLNGTVDFVCASPIVIVPVWLSLSLRHNSFAVGVAAAAAAAVAAAVAAAQTRLCLTAGPRTEEDKEIILYSILKMIFMEQVGPKRIVKYAKARVDST